MPAELSHFAVVPCPVVLQLSRHHSQLGSGLASIPAVCSLQISTCSPLAFCPCLGLDKLLLEGLDLQVGDMRLREQGEGVCGRVPLKRRGAGGSARRWDKLTWALSVSLVLSVPASAEQTWGQRSVAWGWASDAGGRATRLANK